MSDESLPRQRWWNIEGWGLRRKVTAVLAVPVTVAMVLGGLRVEEELSNAVHFSSAADQVSLVPEIVDFSTAFATATASAAAGVVTPEEMARLGDTFGTVRTIAENPDFDGAVTADLDNTVATAQTLYTKLQSGPVPIEEIATVTNEVRDNLNRIVEAILDQTSDQEVVEYGTRLINAWYSQRYLFGQVMGVLQILNDPSTPGTQLISASGGELAMLELLARSYPLADAQIAELRKGVQERTDMVAAAGQGPLPILNLRASMLHSVDVYGGIIEDASQQISSTVLDRAAETRSAALRDTAIVLATLLAALVLALLVSRSLVGPIRRLRYGTLKVARQELPEAIDRIKVGDDIEDIEFTRVPVHTTEEIGQLARAVDDMHGQALRLAGEQAHLRLQINDMFETLARRSKSLVEQQLGLIEKLEYEEKDPTRLESLFRLDHLAARMRRNGDNLLILSGTRMRRGHSAPVQLGDILRAAMSEVEDYQRVQIGSTPDGALSGAVATDIVHLLAELVDNSLRASPPDSNVTFSFARAVDGGLLVEIADRGIGIPSDELETINDRLAQGGEVGPDTARHMGLFVVSRLAERHALTVRLRPTFDTARNPGITASVHIPDVLLVSPLALSQTGPQPLVTAEVKSEKTASHEMPQLPVSPAEKEPDNAPSQPVRTQTERAEVRAEQPRAEQARPEQRRSESGRPEFTPAETLRQAPPSENPRQALPSENPRQALPQETSRQLSPQEIVRQALPQEVARRSGAGTAASSGLPQRRPGTTPGLPTRQPGATPGLPQPQSQPAPRRIQPDAAAAFVSALPQRSQSGSSVEAERARREHDRREREQHERYRSEQQEREQQERRLQEPQNRHEQSSVREREEWERRDWERQASDRREWEAQPRPSSFLPAPHPAPAPAAPTRRAPDSAPAERSSGLPQRRPGATPGMPPRPSVPAQSPAPAPASAHAQRSTVPAPGLPQRQPGATPGLSAPGQPGRTAGQQATHEAPAGLPQRRPGATPGLPPRRSDDNGSFSPSAASAPSSGANGSVATGERGSANIGDTRASRHRYRTNSAKTASFFQPRPDVNALRPHPAAGTPIFSNMMSDWLIDPTSLPEDRRKREWQSAADAGWEAAQRAAAAPVEEHTTAGLPRRAPGHRLVPGAVKAPTTAEQPKTIRRRDPEAIRANLSRHQQGVLSGRASANASTRENNEQGVR